MRRPSRPRRKARIRRAPTTSASQAPPPVEHKGVITPPQIGDEGIHTEVPNPDAGHDEEVIPPPGTPDGEPDVDPR